MGVNVLLRPVSAESLDNLVNTSTAPFISRETARAAQALNSPAPGGFLIISDEGSDLVDQPWPTTSLYDYPPPGTVERLPAPGADADADTISRRGDRHQYFD
ncbi:Putative membrane protein igaA homolog [Citrobacter freundii]|nr:Putative membrane protein igaA homolog [Citrobacter freundii]